MIVSPSTSALAALTASCSEQLASQVPSPGSLALVTTYVVTYSSAPRSQLAPTGRVTPRWSTLPTGAAAQVDASPASMAGEPGSRAIVWVDPPLSPRVSSCGSPLIAPAAEQVPTSTRLFVLVPAI